eukprot:TRINITY_DN9995_c0_g1_i1.p1 TRINITY_DN9995_c0_g1~~TRINITY_DN9995_c0_g1_i1.p1  ORF type:complete len:631 (-),score=107.34 TRINITY_DN9995_c0_g1_i1:15-1907(-)
MDDEFYQIRHDINGPPRHWFVHLNASTDGVILLTHSMRLYISTSDERLMESIQLSEAFSFLMDASLPISTLEHHLSSICCQSIKIIQNDDSNQLYDIPHSDLRISGDFGQTVLYYPVDIPLHSSQYILQNGGSMRLEKWHMKHSFISKSIKKEFSGEDDEEETDEDEEYERYNYFSDPSYRPRSRLDSDNVLKSVLGGDSMIRCTVPSLLNFTTALINSTWTKFEEGYESSYVNSLQYIEERAQVAVYDKMIYLSLIDMAKKGSSKAVAWLGRLIEQSQLFDDWVQIIIQIAYIYANGLGCRPNPLQASILLCNVLQPHEWLGTVLLKLKEWDQLANKKIMSYILHVQRLPRNSNVITFLLLSLCHNLCKGAEDKKKAMKYCLRACDFLPGELSDFFFFCSKMQYNHPIEILRKDLLTRFSYGSSSYTEICAKLVEWYEDELHKNMDYVCYYLGELASMGSKESFDRIVDLAKSNHPHAMMRLGGFYSHGVNVQKSELEARRYFHLAAEKGDSISNRILGEIYMKAIKEKKDYLMLSLYHYLFAFSKGDEPSIEDLLHSSHLFSRKFPVPILAVPDEEIFSEGYLEIVSHFCSQLNTPEHREHFQAFISPKSSTTNRRSALTKLSNTIFS